MKQFYAAVGAAIEKKGKFLVLHRSPEKDAGANMWEIVTGRLEEEENPEIGALREIEEEVGLKAEVIMPIYTSFFYRGSKEYPMVFMVYWCKYLEGEVKLSWEHTEYKWLTLEEAIDEPNLKIFSKVFENIYKLKKFLPKDFKL